MFSRFHIWFVLMCCLCVSICTQRLVSAAPDNFYEEWRRNFVPAPTHKPLPRRQVRSVPSGELTENNASQWSSFASDGANTTLSNDSVKFKAGKASLLFSTKSAGDTGIRYPASGAAHFDVTSKSHLVFWAYGYNTNSNGFEGNQPLVVLRSQGGSIRFTPSTQVMSNDSWRYYSIPLSGSEAWVRTDIGSPDLSDVLSIEIHQDSGEDSFSVRYDGVAFAYKAPVPPAGLNPDVIAPRVLLYCFDPIMENMGGKRLHETYGFYDPIWLTNQIIADFKTSSHGLYQPQIVETKIVDEHPYFLDGYQTTDESFKAIWDMPYYEHDLHLQSSFDYVRFARENNIVSRVESGDIDEVWIYAAPISGTWEATMGGDGGFFLNGVDSAISAKRLFPIMGLNFERHVAEAIHSFGHRLESTISRSYGGWPDDQSTNWSKFVLLDKTAPGLGGVGNVHFPVNATAAYDYAPPSFVRSNADDWTNYPNFQNTTRILGTPEWSPNLVDPHREYLNWWYSHLPHGSGVGSDGFLNNWWRYFGDVHQFKSWNGNLSQSQNLPTVAITSPQMGQAVSGTVDVTAGAFVDGILGRVDFYVDGVYQATDTLAPYKFAWDTSALSGIHRLEAHTVELSAGHEAISLPVWVNVGDSPLPVQELSVSNETGPEGNRGSSQLTFSVTRGGDVSLPASVSYTTTDNSAQAGKDYEFTTGTLTFAPGEAKKTVTVSLLADKEVEKEETFFLDLANMTNGYLTKGRGTGTIQDTTTSASIDDVAVLEGNSAANMVFTVTLSPPISTSVDIDYVTPRPSLLWPPQATPGEDYTPVSGTLHFEPNQAAATISVPLVDDNRFEYEEWLYVDLSADPTAGVVFAKNQGIGIIQNDDSLPVVSIKSPPSVVEGNSGTTNIVYTLSLSHVSGAPVTVSYGTYATYPIASATPNQDYIPISGSVVFEPGQLEKKVPVQVIGDVEAEDNEVFNFSLTQTEWASMDPLESTRRTIILNDETSVSVNDVSVSEGNINSTAAFTVTLSPPIPLAVDVNYTTNSSGATDAATANSDYTPISGKLHFEPNQSSATVSVPIQGDGLFEHDESFYLDISSSSIPPVTISKFRGIGTIRNDEPTPTLSMENATPLLLTEGDSGTKQAAASVLLTPPSAFPVSVSYATTNGTATSGSDYGAASGVLSFSAGQTKQSLYVPILGDVELEKDETFSVNLSSPVNASIGRSSGTATIRNDDTTISAEDMTLYEGNTISKALLKVTLSPSVPVAVDVNYTTKNATVKNAATPGEDYTPVSGTLRMAPYQESALIAVPIRGDLLLENDEVIQVAISAKPGIVVTKPIGTITLRNDDVTPLLLPKAPPAVIEGNSGTRSLVFSVSLSRPSELPVSVAYSAMPGKINPTTPVQDYVPTSGTLIFSPGQTTKTVTVPVRGDILDEADETVTLSLSKAVGAALNGTIATATITDDDTGQVSVGPTTIVEGNTGKTLLRFPITLSFANSRPVSVTYSTGTTTTARATANTDYIPAAGTLTLAPGQTRATIDVTVVGDVVDEEDERIALALKTVQNALLGVKYVEGVIRDDDAPARLSIADISINEGNRASYATFLISLSGVSGRPVSVSYITAPGTATQGSDFTATSGTLSFAPGETQKRINVPVVGDLVRENNEAFFIKLTNLQNAQFARAQATCTLLNDDK